MTGVANGQTLLLDIFEPANHDGLPRPAIILIQGGAWTSFDKSTMRQLAQFLAVGGVVAIPADYRLFDDDLAAQPDPDGMKVRGKLPGRRLRDTSESRRDASPISHVAKSNAPILIIHGTRDEMVPITQAEALDQALKKSGAPISAARDRSRPRRAPATGSGHTVVLLPLPGFRALIAGCFSRTSSQSVAARFA